MHYPQGAIDFLRREIRVSVKIKRKLDGRVGDDENKLPTPADSQGNAMRITSLGRCWIFCCFLIVSCISVPVFAQSPAPLATPNLQLHYAGTVLASTALPDGSVLVGGAFSSFDGSPRMNLAKILSDGSLDPNFMFGNGSLATNVYAIAVDTSGNIFVGGYFHGITGTVRNGLAKFLPDGSLDPTWNPGIPYNFSQSVHALALDGSGNLYVGGSFTTIGGQALARLAKVSTTGTGVVDTSWNPAPDNAVAALTYDGAGNLFVGGSFANIGGVARNGVAKLSSAGVVDANWNPAPNAGGVSAFALDGSGNIFVGGGFTSIGTQTRTALAKLSAIGTGAADASWNPTPTGTNTNVDSLALDTSGNVYVGGNFSTIDGKPLSNLAKLSATGTGTADASWNPAPDSNVNTLALQGANVIAGGAFLNAGGVRHLGLSRIDATGAVDTTTPDAEIPGQVRAITMWPDGSMIVGGFFLKSGQTTRKSILRVLPDGTLDPNWDAPADGFVVTLAQDGAGSVYVGGTFANIGGQPRTGLAKVAATGTGSVDTTWNPSIISSSGYSGINALAFDGSYVYLGGLFDTINGATFGGNLARISTSGSGAADTSWDANAGGQGQELKLALDGSNGYLYAGGYNGLNRFSISTGAIDAIWNPAPDNEVDTLALDGSGNLFVGGRFQNIGTQAQKYLAKLSTSGTGVADSSWNPSANGQVRAIALDGIGNLYAGGQFFKMGVQSRQFIAKLSATGTGVVDATWNPSADNSLLALTLNGSKSRIYAEGVLDFV